MTQVQQIEVAARPVELLEPYVGTETIGKMASMGELISRRLAGHTLWNVNSTATGGGVAELLASVLEYPRALGVDVRWAVIEGSPEFFAVTKRLHHALQGSVGDGSP